MAKRIAILGSTGSIGCNALDVIEHLGGDYRAVALSARKQTDKLIEQVRRHKPVAVALADDADDDRVAREIEKLGALVYHGTNGLVEIVQRTEIDQVLAAIVGAAGLPAVFAAVQAGKAIALANKESLVIAGSLLIPEARKRNVPILPVDSEHSAVFQAMQAGRRDQIKRVILTASGGPFRDATPEQIARATVQDALNHPTWKMGAKVTIDSATMFNKGLELIEACWLFDLPPSKVEVVVHPESIIHSMVEFVDGSTIAQLSPPDMRTPIQYALTYPERREGCGKRMDWSRPVTLRFDPPDPRKFPALAVAYEVAEKGGTAGAVMNAANEVAVEAFMAGKIPFGGICEVVQLTIRRHTLQTHPTMDDLMEADRWARNGQFAVVVFFVVGSAVRTASTKKGPHGGPYERVEDHSLMPAQLPSILLLIFGFGFVIFFHELGHFLAAKWVGIKVEQFAVGFGHALIAWRKGLGFTFGSSAKRYESLVEQGQGDNIGETEYRLNWIPLGGYVKMLGQDDLNPNAQHEDPRAYNKKSIGARMFVVSAGVIMNIFLAAIGFMIVFSLPGGFRVQAPVIGSIASYSPAAMTTRVDGSLAPLQAGDRILMYDGTWQHDFTKITLNVALSGEGLIPIYVEHPNGTRERLNIVPERSSSDGAGFLDLGIRPASELRGVDADAEVSEEILKDPDKFVTHDTLAVKPGEKITAINGDPIKDEKKDHWKLGQAIRDADGKPITITVMDKDGKTREEKVCPRFMNAFGKQPLSFAGMVPRAAIEQVTVESSAKGKVLPGDVILSMEFKNGDTIRQPTVEEFRERLGQAGKTAQPVTFRVLRDGKEVVIPDLVPSVRLEKGVYGLGVAPTVDDQHAVVAQTLDKSPAHDAGIPDDATLTAINGKPVFNWFDVRRELSQAKPGQTVKVAALTTNGPIEREIKLEGGDIAKVTAMYYTHPLALHDLIEPRKAPNAAVAAGWGVTETRDFILQFYLTLHRMVTGRVSYKNMMGPVGIFNAGRQFAYKGPDWLIWFLAMISANLAVVNFLPIPIVDGGLFTFLIVEKIQGRPLSAKTQSIAQVVGLAIILSVFFLVTYQDIARMVL